MDYTSKEVYEYISKQLNDKIVEWKRCRLSGQEFPIYQSDLEFYDKVSPTFEVSEEYAKEFLEKNRDVKENFEYKDGKLKAKIPTPTLCPEEREAQRFVFRNEMCLYRSTSSITGKNIISTFSPDKDYIVYESKIWWENNWDCPKIDNIPSDKTFFSILNELIRKVPIWDKYGLNNENCDYVNISDFSKKCYMCYASSEAEDCLYIKDSLKNKYCVDCLYINYCENCFDCVKCDSCFGVYHSNDCANCSDSYYLYNCTGCHDCFNCNNLTNQSYCINNKQYSKEEYKKLLPSLKPENMEKIIRGCTYTNSENCYGGSLVNCHNCYFVGTGTDCKDTKYTSSELISENCYDSFRGSHNCIYTNSCRYSDHCGIITHGIKLNNCRYSHNCWYCNNCFGCVGLTQKEYCIFNKEYQKEEYNKKVPEIIAQMMRDKEWGEFFDPQLSYYGYNESMNVDYHPLTKDEALKRGYKRSDYKAPAPVVEKFVPGNKLPKQGCKIIKEKKPEILEKILNYAVICEVSKKPFRITKQEIDFYIEHDLPLPTKHPDVRHKERFARKDPTTMNLIHCDECGEEMLSVHLPGKGKKILCEECFYKNK